MAITNLIGGPLSGKKASFSGDEFEVHRSELRMTFSSGEIYAVNKIGTYRKFAGVPDQAIWMGWRS